MKSKMLILHRVSPGGHRYYLRAVGDGPRRGEVPGAWLMGAAGIGVDEEGPVTAVQLQCALPTGTTRVAAFDATFAAPKSVSILHGIGSAPVRTEVEAAHDEGVRAGLLYLERHACAVRSRGSLVAAEGLVVAGFRHRVSRALDPHLHTHALVANRVAAPDDGRPLALHSPLLYGSRRAAGAVYQAVLRRRLTTSLGLTWSVPVGGRADAQAVPSRVRSAFSVRGRQVLGASGNALSERAWAARVTRPPRDGLIDIEALRSGWEARAEALGWAVPVLGPGLTSSLPIGAIPSVDRWTRSDVMVMLADGCRSGATFDELEAACERVLRDPQVMSVGSDNWHATPRYTTQVAVERRAQLLPSRRVDGQPEAIDRRRRGMPGRMLLVTPDVASAAALEARTGAVASDAASAVTATLGPGDLVVLVRPHRIESVVLERALRGCRAEIAIAAIERGSATGASAQRGLSADGSSQRGASGPAWHESAVGSARRGASGPAWRESAVGSARRGASGPAWRESAVGIADRVADSGGTVTAAADARTAADHAIRSWIDAQRLGRPAILVALPDEVDIMTVRARHALFASGLRSQEDGGWAVGDLAWFDAARPTLGVDRHTLADVTAVGASGLTLAVGGREIEVGADQMLTVRSGSVVPPLPGLLAGGRELFVIGGWLPPGGRGRGAVHRHITVDAQARRVERTIDRSRSI